jgi:hypothetical protein
MPSRFADGAIAWRMIGLKLVTGERRAMITGERLTTGEADARKETPTPRAALLSERLRNWRALAEQWA